MPKKKWKWEISPHPYSHEWDCMVTNSDEEALKAILHVAEMHLWDGNDGGERIVKVVRNPDHRRRPACRTRSPTGGASSAAREEIVGEAGAIE